MRFNCIIVLVLAVAVVATLVNVVEAGSTKGIKWPRGYKKNILLAEAKPLSGGPQTGAPYLGAYESCVRNCTFPNTSACKTYCSQRATCVANCKIRGPVPKYPKTCEGICV
jgi:hypothetical protein